MINSLFFPTIAVIIHLSPFSDMNVRFKTISRIFLLAAVVAVGCDRQESTIPSSTQSGSLEALIKEFNLKRVDGKNSRVGSALKVESIEEARRVFQQFRQSVRQKKELKTVSPKKIHNASTINLRVPNDTIVTIKGQSARKMCNSGCGQGDYYAYAGVGLSPYGIGSSWRIDYNIDYSGRMSNLTISNYGFSPGFTWNQSTVGWNLNNASCVNGVVSISIEVLGTTYSYNEDYHIEIQHNADRCTISYAEGNGRCF